MPCNWLTIAECDAHWFINFPLINGWGPWGVYSDENNPQDVMCVSLYYQLEIKITKRWQSTCMHLWNCMCID